MFLKYLLAKKGSGSLANLAQVMNGYFLAQFDKWMS